MSKWNKNSNQQPLSEEFIQNQERRKQMIIEAARRRKEKEKKQQELQQQQRKNNEEALTKHKQEKKDAYIKYLRSNIHDKYEQAKRKEKDQGEEIKVKAKWRKKSQEKDEKEGGNDLEALDLEVRFEKDSVQSNPGKSQKEGQITPVATDKQKIKQDFNREWLAQSFQNQWNQRQNDELLSSQLLDSLDLDIGTMQRNKEVKRLMKPVRLPPIQKEQPKIQEVLKLRELIGYESIVCDVGSGKQVKMVKIEQNKVEQEEKTNIQKKSLKKGVERKEKPQGNEVQTFNELKHKKEAKIMNWAIEQQQEAEDLFSNCSTKKSAKALKELNQQLKNAGKNIQNAIMKKKELPTISEEQSINANANMKVKINKARGPTGQSEALKERIASRGSRQRQTQKRDGSLSKQQPKMRKTEGETIDNKPKTAGEKINSNSHGQRQPPKTVSGFESQTNLVRNRTSSREVKQQNETQPQYGSKQKKESRGWGSRQKKQNRVASQNQSGRRLAPESQPKRQKQKQVPQSQLPKIPPLPVPLNRTQYNPSIATYDLQMDVESFIRQDLMNLNEHERKLQQQLRDLYLDHKQDIKEVYQKYQIKTDYKHSQQLAGGEGQPKQTSGYSKKYAYQTEQDIQESLQNLDHMLIRKQLLSREKAIIEKTEEDDESKSFINPFSRSEDLCQQVLQLAQNVSRFQEVPTEPKPDGYMSKARKVGNQKYTNLSKGGSKYESKVISNCEENDGIGDSVCESEEVSRMTLRRPPLIESLTGQKEEKEAKIHVNAKLLKGMLLDND